MPAVHIRNLDDSVITRLKHRAAANHRSLEGELREVLVRAADSDDENAKPRRLVLKTVSVPTSSRYDRDEIYRDDER
jgi:plasmid stability protein